MNKHLVPTLPLIFFLQYMGLHFVSQIRSQGTLQGHTGRNPAPAPHPHVCRKYFAARMYKPLRISPMEWGSEEDNLLPSRHLAGVGQPEGGGGGGRWGAAPPPGVPMGVTLENLSKARSWMQFFSPQALCFSKSNLRRDRELECKS